MTPVPMRARISYCIGLLVGAYAVNAPNLWLAAGAAILGVLFVQLVWKPDETPA